MVSVPDYEIRYLPAEKTIELNFPSGGRRMVIVTDIQGHLLKKTAITDTKARISIINHSKGLYVITVIEEGSRPVSRKVMVY